jgi:nucleoid-associated protein YgaU
MIFQGSRYANADVLPIAAPDGTYRSTIVPAPETSPSKATRHRVVQGDRMDTLAFTAYGDPTLWWVIADANPLLFYPDLLVPGSVILVPVTVGT